MKILTVCIVTLGVVLQDAPVKANPFQEEEVSDDSPLVIVESKPVDSTLGLVVEKADAAGLIVGHVLKASAADKAGIKKGDVIVAADKKILTNASDLVQSVVKSGNQIELTILREGKLKKVSLAVTAHPATTPTTPPPPATPPLPLNALPEESVEALPPPAVVEDVQTSGASLGVTVVDVSIQARQRYNLVVRRGAAIAQVRRGSPAAAAGLPVGGVIVAFDGQRVDGANALVRYIQLSRPGREVEITYYNGRRLERRTVRLEASGRQLPPNASSARNSIPTPSSELLNPRPARRPALGIIQDLVEGINTPPTPGPNIDSPQTPLSVRRDLIEMHQKIDWLTKRVAELEADLANQRRQRKTEDEPLPIQDGKPAGSDKNNSK